MSEAEQFRARNPKPLVLKSRTAVSGSNPRTIPGRSHSRGPGSLGGTRHVAFPRFLTPYRTTTSRDAYPPSSRDPPSGRDHPRPSCCTSLGRGKGSRLERGSQLVVFSNCGRFRRGNTTSWVPPASRDPSPDTGRSHSPNIHIRPTGFNMTGFLAEKKAHKYKPFCSGAGPVDPWLGVLFSHHLKCEKKRPHLVDVS